MFEKLKIDYNPFEKMISIESENGKWGNENGLAGDSFDYFVSKIPELIYNEILDDSDKYEITFIGREFEHITLDNALSHFFENKNVEYKIIHNRKYEFNLKEYITEFETLPDNYIDKDKKRIILDELKSTVKMNVLGLYSSGKSTFINALLGDDILYTHSDVATNKILKIYDTDDESVSIKSICKDGNTNKYEIDEENSLRDTLEKLNSSDDLKEIQLNIDIPSIDCTMLNYELLDTPGVNNSQNTEHKHIAYDNIADNENMPLILFIVNINSYVSDDQETIFNSIKKALEDNNKQNQERFLFVVNRADEIKRKDFDNVVENIKKYLNTIFNKNVNLYFTDSYHAVLIKKVLSTIEIEDEDDQDSLDLYLKKIREGKVKFLPEYSTISLHEKELLQKNKIIDDNDTKKEILKKALLCTGIPTVEKVIQNYIDHHATLHKFQYAYEKVSDYLKKYSDDQKELNQKKNQIQKELEVQYLSLDDLRNGISENSQLKKLYEDEIINLQNTINDLNQFVNDFKPEVEKFKVKIENLKINNEGLNKINREWLDTIERLKNEYGNDIKYIEKLSLKLSEKGTALISEARTTVRNDFRKKAQAIELDFQNIVSERSSHLGLLHDQFLNEVKVNGLDQHQERFNVSSNQIKTERETDGWDYLTFGISKLFRDKENIDQEKVNEISTKLKSKIATIGNDSNQDLTQLKDKANKQISGFEAFVQAKLNELKNEEIKLNNTKEELETLKKANKSQSKEKKLIENQISEKVKELKIMDDNLKSLEEKIKKLTSLLEKE